MLFGRLGRNQTLTELMHHGWATFGPFLTAYSGKEGKQFEDVYMLWA